MDLTRKLFQNSIPRITLQGSGLVILFAVVHTVNYAVTVFCLRCYRRFKIDSDWLEETIIETWNSWRFILNTADSPHTQNHPASNWQILGELELSVGASADDTLTMWLKETLNSLNLGEDFPHRILESTQKTVARVLQADVKVKLEHVHLRVLAPSNHTSQQQTWGFFSVERLNDTEEGNVANEHTLEIYLYVEGDDHPTRGNQ